MGIMRRMVYDFLAEKSKLTVVYEEEEVFDSKLMEELAQQSLAREEEEAAELAKAAEAAGAEEGKKNEVDAQEKKAEAEAKVNAEAEVKAKAEAEAKASAEAEAKAKAEAEAKAKAEADAKAEAEAAAKAEAEANSPEKRAEKYGAIEDVEARAFAILSDLGMIDGSSKADSSDALAEHDEKTKDL